MLDLSLSVYAIAGAILGIAAAAVTPFGFSRPAFGRMGQRPSPRSMPATQTADVNAKAGADPAALA